MTHLLHEPVKTPPTLRLLLGSALILFIAAHSASSSSAAGTLTVTGVAVNHSAVKIYFNPVSGARDYRVYDVANPNNVKYAGMAHLIPSTNCPGSSCFRNFAGQSGGVTPVFPYQVVNGPAGGPQVLDIAAAEIDWNNVGDNNLHTLVVEAVDQLGPAPQG